MSMLVDYDSRMYLKATDFWIMLMQATHSSGRLVTGVTTKTVDSVDEAFAAACGGVVYGTYSKVEKLALIQANTQGFKVIVADPHTVEPIPSFSINHDGDVLVLINGKPQRLAKKCDGWERAVAYGMISMPDLAKTIMEPLMAPRKAGNADRHTDEDVKHSPKAPIESFGLLGSDT